MSANLIEWLFILAFFLLVGGFMVAEAFWISKKDWASFGTSLAFSALSNFIGFAVGLFVFFIVMGLFLMFSLDGTTDRILNSKVGGPMATVVLAFGFLVTPILLIICKRFFLAALKIQTGKTAWFYALTSSILILIIAIIIPILITYFTFR